MPTAAHPADRHSDQHERHAARLGNARQHRLEGGNAVRGDEIALKQPKIAEVDVLIAVDVAQRIESTSVRPGVSVVKAFVRNRPSRYR
jgi:hypothetical protein